MSRISCSFRPMRGLVLVFLFGSTLLSAGCRSHDGGPQKGRSVTIKYAARPAAPPAVPVVADSRPEPDPYYQKFVRPFLARYGCASGNCHGTFKGGGFYFLSVDVKDMKDYQSILSRIDRKEPEKSELVQKMLGKLQHNGGRNIDESSCDFQRLIAWIGQRQEPKCQDPPPPDLRARFAREVAPALKELGCAAESCHGGEGKARVRLDLNSLISSAESPDRAYLSMQSTTANHYSVWLSKAILAANAEDGIHKQPPADKLSCAYRRLYGYLAGSPEATCQLGSAKATAQHAEPKYPSFEAFVQVVMPTIQRRGCFDGACHGSGAGGMSLFSKESGPTSALNDYLALTARVEDFAHIDQSTLLRTARNQEPHGGGRRLGGHGDCIDDVVSSWLSGRPVKPCPDPQPPPYESYVKVVQPVLDKMTCTNLQCHGGAIDIFRVMQHPTDPKVLMANYQAVIKHIDFDFMPLSGIMLRMREPCAYAVVGAWIDKKPPPPCVVHDPDPNVFPRRDARGNIMHPKFAPDTPTVLPTQKT